MMRQQNRRRYCILFAYDIDSEYAGKYAILTASCLEHAYIKAVERYGAGLVRNVMTEYMFQKGDFESLYGFTLKDDLTRARA